MEQATADERVAQEVYAILAEVGTAIVGHFRLLGRRFAEKRGQGVEAGTFIGLCGYQTAVCR
jgi:hypothetical protein